MSSASTLAFPLRRMAAVLALLAAWTSGAAARQEPEAEDAPPVDPSLFQAMKWRSIGPFRGGRVTAVAGVPGQPLVYYFGSAGGGLWKTEDGGTTWENVSDGFFNTGSVGAVAVAPSDPNVVYAGLGEAPFRGVMSSSGDGVYRSTDAGKSWTHLGLEKTRQISAVRVHPKNPDLVYVAAQGSPWAPTPERGVYRSKDGGRNWELILHVDEGTGASGLSMNPANPRVLYAAFWQHQRKPWKVISGGPGSGIHKTADGGDSWERLDKGLPGPMGKIGVAVSPADPERVWAMVEADEGGLFRSDDAGRSWTRVNSRRTLRARAWYYTHVFADPRDEETVYVLNAPFMKSSDGGKTFTRILTPHGDNHALWINPEDSRIMINGNDGGANVSFNGGKTWSTQSNQPTAQFYRVATDRQFPYRVYGGQQDNSTVSIASRAMDGRIGREDWHSVGGCESAHLAFDPDSPDLVYAGCYQGLITEYSRALQLERDVMAVPYLGLGSDPKDLPYRFNWNAPILVSPHDPSVIYHAGNQLLKSTDRGLSWTEISPDLTRSLEEHLGKGGGPLTNEAAGGETYHTILYVVESPHQAGVIWAGSDDGLLHLTRDGGAAWDNVTPKGLAEGMINAVEVSPHDPASAYIAFTRYKFDDFAPYIFKTEDFGKSWTKLTEGIGDQDFVRAVREDPRRRGLLYAASERGVHVSFDDGRRWQPFRLNLPVVPVTDLTVRDGDLVASTQGRAFWILDDLSPLRQIAEGTVEEALHLFKPRAAVRSGGGDGGGGGGSPAQGKNPPYGAIVHYSLAEAPTEGQALELEILDARGRAIRSFSSLDEPPEPPEPGFPAPDFQRLSTEKGLNRFVWNLRVEDLARVPGLVVYGGLQGYRIAPGAFRARLKLGEEVREEAFEVVQDPRTDIGDQDFLDQQQLLGGAWEAADGIHRTVNRLRGVRRQVKGLIELTASRRGAKAIADAGEALGRRIDELEGRLVQPKQKTFQDVINFPNQLNADLIQLMSLVDQSDPPLTRGARRLSAELQARWSELRAEARRILETEVADFNALVEREGVSAIIVPEPDSR